jgi:two-component system sensor histidine kinase AlgZ
VRVRITNPFVAAVDHHPGNRMALANIRERLQLHFDAEASLQTRAADGTFEVEIRLPYIRSAP